MNSSDDERAKKSTKQMPSTSSSSENDEEDFDLEVLPPSKTTQGKPARGPRLSASGGGERDPIALLESSSDEEVDDSLLERLHRRKEIQSTTASALRTSTASTRPQTLKQPPIAAAASKTATAYESSSSDSSSDDSLAKKIKSLTQKKPKAKLLDDIQPSKRKPPPKPISAPLSSQISSYPSPSSSSSPPNPKQQTKRAHKNSDTKHAERLHKQHVREQAKASKEREKLAVKRAREAKKEAEQREKRRRQELKDDNRQQKGGYSVKEIAVLMDPTLFRHAQLQIADELLELKYHVIEYPSMMGCRAVQWIRKDLKRGEGGAEGAIAAMRAGDRNGFVHLPVVGVVFDAHEFIKLLERDHNEEDDYPKLEEWLLSVHAGWRAAWRCEPKKRPRIILFLYKVTQTLEQLWIEYKRSKQPAMYAPPSEEELKDAMAWLLIQFQVECVECREADHLSMEMNRMTCKLSDEPYQKAYTDLDVSQKLAPLCGADASLYDQAKDCWLRQVQQIPRVSFGVARTLTQHYPTAYSLWSAYNDETMTEDGKRKLLVDCFGDRSQVKLSDQFYRLMTSQNPNDLIN